MAGTHGNGQVGQHTVQCEQCGAGLPLPPSPHVTHVVCPYCRHDTILSQALVQWRVQQHQHAEYLRREQQAEVYEARISRGRWWRKALMIVGPVLFMGLFGFGLVVYVLGVGGDYLGGDDPDEKKPSGEGEPDGSQAVRARIAALRAVGCRRMSLGPNQHRGEQADFWLTMNRLQSCRQIVAAAGAPDQVLTLEFTSAPGPKLPVPPPGPSIDYRLCPQVDGTYVGNVKASSDQPFTVGVIQCPRKPGEGGVRSKQDDDTTNGRKRAVEWLKQLNAAGCRSVSKAAEVLKGYKEYNVTIEDPSMCYSALFVSAFPDAKLSVELLSPLGESLPAPPTSHELRLIYCPKHRGRHGLKITPATPEHYTMATIDCPRNGKEGLRREREMIQLAEQARAVEEGAGKP